MLCVVIGLNCSVLLIILGTDLCQIEQKSSAISMRLTCSLKCPNEKFEPKRISLSCLLCWMMVVCLFAV